MSNYPMGTGPNDPKAPWNEPEPKFEECPHCEGTGLEYPDDEIIEGVESEKCHRCKGECEIEQED